MSIVWTDEKLDQLHSCLLRIILEVDRVCRKNGITYFLGGGTLLGAVRNGGFLPWDEDADLMMKRDDYERFRRAAKKELGADFFIQDHETDPHSHRPYIRVRLNGTIMATDFSSHFPSSHQGIFVDIFCHDKTAKSRIGQKLHIAATVAVNSLVFRKWESMAEGIRSNGIKSIISRPFPIRLIEKWQDRIYRLFDRKAENKFLYDGMGKHLRRGGFPEKWLDDNKRIIFEGHMLPVPSGYDEYLKWLYGDYKRVPERSEQTPSADVVKLEFGKQIITEEEHEGK